MRAANQGLAARRDFTQNPTTIAATVVTHRALKSWCVPRVDPDRCCRTLERINLSGLFRSMGRSSRMAKRMGQDAQASKHDRGLAETERVLWWRLVRQSQRKAVHGVSTTSHAAATKPSPAGDDESSHPERDEETGASLTRMHGVAVFSPKAHWPRVTFQGVVLIPRSGGLGTPLPHAEMREKRPQRFW
jgi:hypothetical protein